ncbi:hypothetical protein Lser_V15G29771 [Lactuca serriola]
MAKKPKAASTSDLDYVPSDQDQLKSNEGENVHLESSPRGNTHPRSPTLEVRFNEFGPTPPPSPSPTTVPILMAPVPPPVTSQRTSTTPIASTAPLPPPIITQATTTTTTTEPPVVVNVSDTRAATKGIDIPVTSKPLSPPPSTESDTVLGVADMEYDSIYYSPYHVLSDDDDDAPITKRHLKDVNEKLDRLLASSSTSSNSAYSDTAVKALIETSIQKHDESIQTATKTVDASTLSCKNASAEVGNIIEDANIFLDSLKGVTESNANKVNSAIDSLSKSLQGEQQKFEVVRASLKTNEIVLLSSISSRLNKLQNNLAMENKVMDELALCDNPKLFLLSLPCFR